ncbi:C-X-C chemokine receptor type 3-2 [Anguilla rostrata]|uniref:C-X-C chemokine receptor type 3-2 n=1 Tax=Anguilla rostrata TaxID=7938 RepID=UPI0030CDF412
MATTDDYYDEDYNSTFDYGSLPAPCDLQNTWQFGSRFCPVVYSLVFLLAVVGNVLVLCVVWRYRHSRRGPCSFNLTDTFLLHLAVSDLLLALTLPFYSVQWAREWLFGTAACKVASAAFSLNLYSGILFLACISFDRYLAIVHAVSAGWRRNTCHAQIACAVIWVACLSLAAIDIQYREVVELPRSDIRVCQLVFSHGDSQKWQVSLQLVSMVVGFGLPLLVMLYCYVRIFRALCHATRRQKRKSLRLIVSLVSVFLLCWAPYNGFRLVDSLQRLSVIGQSCSLDHALDVGTLVSESVGLAHCAFNPLLYGFVGVKFRRELVEMWKGLLSSVGLLRLDSWGQKRHRATGPFSSESENTSYSSVVM